MNETYVNVVGNVVADPDERRTQSGDVFTTFRVASTIRRPARDGHGYEDGHTSFYNVIAFRTLAHNILTSVERGHPVCVYGRQRVSQFQRDDGSFGTSIEIEAISLGHDLSRGTCKFTKGSKARVDANDRLTDPEVNAARESEWSSEYVAEDESPAASAVPDPVAVDVVDSLTAKAS